MSFGSEHALAVLVDIENMSRPGARNRGEFDIHLVLGRLAEKGRVVVKRAYADWSRYRDARRELMNAGLELIEMPSAREGAKNRADIKMAVDAMEIAYSRTHVSTFVIVSGDSDFTPLIGKLRELDKRVIGIGRDEASASTLLIANCDEFYFYDSMASTSKTRHAEGQRPDALSLLRETLEARGREGDEHPQASAVKDSMRRRDPAFSENDIGFSTFSKFLEDAQTKGIVRLVTDARSGTYLVELADGATAWPTIGDEASVRTVERSAERSSSEPTPEGRRRRRRRRGGENGEQGTRETVAEGVEEAEGDGEAEVFEFRVPERDAVVEMPPLDQPLSYEDLLADPEPTPAATDEPPSRGSRRRRKPLSAVAEPDTADLEADEPGEQPAEADAVAPKRTRRRRASAPADVDETTPEAESPVADVAPAVVEASVATSDDEAPTTSRRRVRRGSVLGTIAAEAAPADTEASPEPEEDKPAARRRTTRKKAEPADTDTAGESAEEAAPKRRTRAKATEDAAEETTPKRRTTRKKVETEDAAAEPAADEDKPKRRRTTRKKAADEAPTGEGLSPKESPY